MGIGWLIKCSARSDLKLGARGNRSNYVAFRKSLKYLYTNRITYSTSKSLLIDEDLEWPPDLIG